MKVDTFFFVALISYLIGSFPTYIFLNRLWRRVSRGKGEISPLIVFFLDILKGASALWLAEYLINTHMAMSIAALAVVTGHFWSIFHRFRRRSGMAPLVGALAVLTPQVLPILLLIWGITLLLFRYSTISIVISVVSLPLIMWFYYRYDLFVILGILMAALVLYHQLSEMEKIAWGAETKIGEEPARLGYREYRKKVRSPARTFRRIFLFNLIVMLLAFFYLNFYVYRGFEMQTEIIRAGKPQLNAVAITFDDGPDPFYTPQILDILKEKEIKATFFMVGKHVELYPDIARKIVEEGHDIGNHTYSHRNLLFLDRERALEEIVKAEEAIIEATGERPRYFRPPRGLYSLAVRDIMEEREYKMILWSLSSRDWAEISAREITGHILNDVTGGDILLFHDSGGLVARVGGDRRNTVKALPRVIEELSQRGYQFVTVSELMELSQIE
ncbi:MAG: polysaccharide deacetylase [Candidatus Syntrophonatronum acetioxidans]|uniref:Polysaccharide deacetylase n=1 Tax=Candidatus Syntrophonatronum acetioxidans TaxID=1795816 RepID=A0A424YBS3_9FIRM|nr:MAG: polysaccharide deacetylase [Candidatus Syntrophonatronum acetioxidans]